MLVISPRVAIADDEIEYQAIRAQGAGGQNVNKLATAIHLRFSIRGSSLPALYQARLLALKDQRISDDGVVVIKAQRYRSQERNREDARQRLASLIRSVAGTPKRRIATRPSRRATQRRLDAKARHARTKKLRGRPSES